MANNEIMIPEASALPAYLQAAIAANQRLIQDTLDAAQGIGAGAVPTITAVQGMFKTKVDGVEDVIQIEVPGMGKINAPKIAAVVLKGKPALDRAYFAAPFAQGQEPASPDCSSEDGIKPKADSPNKQCESCAGCAHNMFGSAKMQDGSPGKGKACSEKKRLAIFANNAIYRFNVPPASLGDFAAYARQLTAHGLALSMVITTISFDPETPTKLVFGFQGILPEAAFAKIMPLIDSAEVKAIMDNFSAPAQLAAPANTTPVDDSTAAAAEAKAAADKKAADDKAAAEKKAKAAADKKAKEEKAAADKKAKDDAAAAASAGAGIDLGLGIDLGGAATPEVVVENAVAAGDGANLSDADLAALFSM